jgi:hypothetical protein
MRSVIDAIDEARMALAEKLQCPIAAAGEALLLPDLVQTARVAAVAGNQVLAADPEPAGDPDIDGVGFGEPARSRGSKQRHFHDTTLTGRQQRPLCADDESKVMATAA